MGWWRFTEFGARCIIIISCCVCSSCNERYNDEVVHYCAFSVGEFTFFLSIFTVTLSTDLPLYDF